MTRSAHAELPGADREPISPACVTLSIPSNRCAADPDFAALHPGYGSIAHMHSPGLQQCGGASRDHHARGEGGRQEDTVRS